MLNRLEIIGRLGSDPEVRHLENGAVYAQFSVASTETWKDKKTGEKKEETEWTNVVLWRGLAEVAEKYLKKGDLVYISGKKKTRSYEKEGITRYVVDLIGSELKMLGGKTSSNEKPPIPQDQANQSDQIEGDDLPF